MLTSKELELILNLYQHEQNEFIPSHARTNYFYKKKKKLYRLGLIYCDNGDYYLTGRGLTLGLMMVKMKRGLKESEFVTTI
jgi:hypothetical protein